MQRAFGADVAGIADGDDFESERAYEAYGSGLGGGVCGIGGISIAPTNQIRKVDF